MKICMFLIPFVFVITSCSTTPPRPEPWFLTQEFEVKKNVRTTIYFYGPFSAEDNDSLPRYIIFDSILSRDQKVVFIYDPHYYKKRNDYPNDIVIPMPITEMGVYVTRYKTPDTSYTQKWMMMK